MARDCTPVQLAMVMMECCGLYATCPGTSRMQRAINLLDTTCGLPDTTRQLAAFYGLDGKPLAFTDDHGAPLPWSPCRTRDGTISNLWKRPPLCSIEQLAKFSKSLGPVHGAKTFRRALEMVVAGAASPLEAQAALLMGINRKTRGRSSATCIPGSVSTCLRSTPPRSPSMPPTESPPSRFSAPSTCLGAASSPASCAGTA